MIPGRSDGEESEVGMRLDEYLCSKAFDLSERAPPSRDEIRQAIHSLADYKYVSCTTFETILAMEHTSASIHLKLLLSDIGVFPSCVKLLRVHCHVKRRGLLDDAYGFLCLQVIALSIQVAVLAQTNQLQSFLSTISQQPPTQSIYPKLRSHVRQLERQAMFGPNKRSINWLLGWHQDETTGQLVCLPQMGGCTIIEAKFLVERMWSARAEFLRAAEWAAIIFPGWGSFLHTLWNVIMQNYGGVGPMSFGIMPPERKECWMHFADIAYRYTLCSGENEDQLLPPMLMHCPDFTKPWHGLKPRTSIDVLDSKRITTAFLKKIKLPSPHVISLSMLFAYTCRNFDLSSFESLLSQMFRAMIDRLWDEVFKARGDGLNSEQWTDLGNGVGSVLKMLEYMLEGYPAKREFLLDVATGEDLFELLGCLVVSFVSLSGNSRAVSGFPISGAQSGLWDDISKFGSALKRFASTAHFEPGALVFPTWYRTHQSFVLSIPLANKRRPSVLEMSAFWGKAWLKIGAIVGLDKLSHHTLQCAYPRCAAPDTSFVWECLGCNTKRYCSRRCQQADWICSPIPHASQCSGALSV